MNRALFHVTMRMETSTGCGDALGTLRSGGSGVSSLGNLVNLPAFAIAVSHQPGAPSRPPTQTAGEAARDSIRKSRESRRPATDVGWRRRPPRCRTAGRQSPVLRPLRAPPRILLRL